MNTETNSEEVRLHYLICIYNAERDGFTALANSLVEFYLSTFPETK